MNYVIVYDRSKPVGVILLEDNKRMVKTLSVDDKLTRYLLRIAEGREIVKHEDENDENRFSLRRGVSFPRDGRSFEKVLDTIFERCIISFSGGEKT